MDLNERLHQELELECDRLTEVLSTQFEGSDEWNDTMNKKLELLDKMETLNKIEYDYWNKDEERKNSIVLEQEKKKISWRDIIFNGIIPIGTLVVSIIHYNNARDVILDFEEHGKRIVSTPGRELRLPKINLPFKR